MTNINLTAVLQDRDLTTPERSIVSSTPTNITMTENWITDTAEQMVTDTAEELIFNDLVSATAFPIELTAVVQDRDLTTPERLI